MADIVGRMAQAIADQTGNNAVDWTRVARIALKAMRVTDDDVMSHPTMGSDDQEAINAWIDAALSAGKRPTSEGCAKREPRCPCGLDWEFCGRPNC